MSARGGSNSSRQWGGQALTDTSYRTEHIHGSLTATPLAEKNKNENRTVVGLEPKGGARHLICSSVVNALTMKANAKLLNVCYSNGQIKGLITVG